MLAKLSGAAARGLLVAWGIALPALILPDASLGTPHVTVFVAIIAAGLTFVEYIAANPSFVEFRDAAPLNRVRYTAVLATVLFLSLVFGDQSDPSQIARALTAIGTIVSNGIDVPFSPVRMVLLMLPDGTDPHLIRAVQSATALAFLTSLAALLTFLFLVRIKGWPLRGGAFNVWINLPLFDPSAGGDVVDRLRRDAQVNIALGLMLPLVMPVVVKATADLLNTFLLDNPQTLIWTLTAWAFLPASMIMRGIALQRIAEMIRDQRNRACADPVLQAV